MDSLGTDISWSVAYQSATNRGKWLEPGAESAIVSLIRKGTKTIVVVPVSFLTENLETVYDLDSCLAFFTKEEGAGEVDYIRVKVPAESPLLIKSLSNLIQQKLTEAEAE